MIDKTDNKENFDVGNKEEQEEISKYGNKKKEQKKSRKCCFCLIKMLLFITFILVVSFALYLLYKKNEELKFEVENQRKKIINLETELNASNVRREQIEKDYKSIIEQYHNEDINALNKKNEELIKEKMKMNKEIEKLKTKKEELDKINQKLNQELIKLREKVRKQEKSCIIF